MSGQSKELLVLLRVPVGMDGIEGRQVVPTQDASRLLHPRAITTLVAASEYAVPRFQFRTNAVDSEHGAVRFQVGIQ